MSDLKLTHFDAPPLLDYAFPNDTKVLGITSEGGGGHIQLMKGIEGKITKQNIPFTKADALKDTLPNWMSNYCVSGWNKAKEEGDIEAQEYLVKGTILWIPRHQLADFLFFLPIFLWTVIKLLRDNEISRIVDTQPIGTKAIIRAARLVNFLFARNIRVTKVSTEIATKYACSFSDPAKSLTKNDKKIFELAGPCPFIKKSRETIEDFLNRQEKWWNKHYGLSLIEKEVRYSNYPIRAAFEPYIDTNLRNTINTLSVKINNDDEIIDASAPESTSHEYPIDNNTIVGMITIGSKVTHEATKIYVQSIIEAVKQLPEITQPIKIFVAAGSHKLGEESLYTELKDLIASQALPKNLMVIPMGIQDDTQFAPMMHRADFGIFGSGGMTTMELSATAKGKIFLHSESKRLEKEGKVVKREDGLALWEKGNALHLVKTKGAKIVVPDETFITEMKDFLVVVKVAESSPSEKQHANAEDEI
jgi:hypothetical protein